MTNHDTHIRDRLDATSANPVFATRYQLADALRAVLDLHQADEYGDCRECGVDTGENPIPWPCNTVQTIDHAFAPHPDFADYLANGEVYAGDEG